MSNTLDDIAKLKKGWNGNDAEPIPEIVIKEARRFLKYIIFDYELFPTAAESVQFEFDFDNTYVEIEITKEGYEIYSEDNGKEFTWFCEYDQLYNVINILKLKVNKSRNKAVLITGSFNPPTIAHYHMIENAIHDVKPDFVVFGLANNRFVTKKMSRVNGYVYSEQDRLEMILTMTYNNPNVLIYGIETGYTYDTLCSVKENFKFKDVYFACGDDKIYAVQKWGNHNKLLSEFSFYILTRGNDLEKTKNDADIIFSNTKYIIGKSNENDRNVSSTKLREKIKNGEKFNDLVTKEVYHLLKNMED